MIEIRKLLHIDDMNNIHSTETTKSNAKEQKQISKMWEMDLLMKIVTSISYAILIWSCYVKFTFPFGYRG